MIKEIMLIVMIAFGLYCTIKPNNFLVPIIKYSEFSKTTIQKKYGNKKAIEYIRILGIVILIFAITFYFWVK